MDELIAFITARLDEDEAVARRNIGAGPGWARGLGDNEDHGPDWPDYQSSPGDEDITAANAYLDRFRPLRMLREVEAKRAIVARYEFARNQVAVGVVNEDAGYGPADAGWPLRADSHELDVRSLAAAWADHPDYRADWKP